MNSARPARRWREADGDFSRMAEALNDEIDEDLKDEDFAIRADLRAEIAALRAELIKWIGGVMVLQVVAIVGLNRLSFVIT